MNYPSLFFLFILLCCLPRAAHAGPGQDMPPRIWHENTIDMDFVAVPGGGFVMGCGPWSGTCPGDAVPAHRVRLSPFYMAVTELSNRQWARLLSYRSPRDKIRGNYPVEDVSWFAAAAFTNALSRADNLQPCYRLSDCTGWPEYDLVCRQVEIVEPCNGFHLPTEAQWEYACRSGGLNEKYCGGARDSAPDKGKDIDDTIPVGETNPNGLGIHDMIGNVMEWCQDWYGPYPAADSKSMDPGGPASGRQRVLRGGCWISLDSERRSTARSSIQPDYWNYHFGIRLVRPMTDVNRSQKQEGKTLGNNTKMSRSTDMTKDQSVTR